MAYAVRRGDEARRLELPGEPLSCVCVGAGQGERADLHRAERGPRRDRIHAAEDAGIQAVAATIQHRPRYTPVQGLRGGRPHQGASPLGPCLCGFSMNERQFGTRLSADGASFRLWAPAANRVDLLLDKPHPMRRRENGWFSAEVPGVRAGAHYRFRIDDDIDVPDPASFYQPDDVSGSSEIIDHSGYRWRTPQWRGRPWHEAVLLEAHVGTFTRQGTYRAMIDKLDHLVASGITALELMPIADFAGPRNWGYCGVLWYAVGSPYGRPGGFKALNRQTPLRGFMVFLRVVYNHFGPEGNYLSRYAPSFFTEAHT